MFTTFYTYHIHDITTCKYIWQGPKRASEKALLTEHETFTPDVIANLIFELYKFLTKLYVLLKVPFVSVKWSIFVIFRICIIVC